MLLIQAHDVADEIELRILQLFPYADVIIHLDPVSIADKEVHAKTERFTTLSQ